MCSPEDQGQRLYTLVAEASVHDQYDPGMYNAAAVYLLFDPLSLNPRSVNALFQFITAVSAVD